MDIYGFQIIGELESYKKPFTFERPITRFELHKKEPTKLELQKNELTKFELHKLEPIQKRTLLQICMVSEYIF